MKIIASIILCLTLTAGFAQGRHNNYSKEQHAKIEQLKKVYLSEELSLNEADSIAFWPVYDKYSTQLKDLHHQIKAKHKSAAKAENLTENEYKDLIEELIDLEKKEVNLKAEFIVAVADKIGYQKAAKLPSLEHSFRKKLLREYRERRSR